MPNAEERRRQLYQLFGDLPPRDRPINARLVRTERRAEYQLDVFDFDLNGVERVPGYFVKPLGATGRLPTILYNHAHGGDYPLGKDELTQSRSLLQPEPYAVALTRAGYAALCIDHWAFGQRATRPEADIFKHMIWQGQVMWGMMVYDSLRAVDYLVSRDDVDTNRLGTLGLSMGSLMAWYVAALDERIKVCVDLCCLGDFQSLIETNMLEGHGIYYYVPSLLKYFTTAQINALIAPRPHLGLAGDLDLLTPPHGLDRIDAELKQVYASLNASDCWRLLRYPVGHLETAEMRVEVLVWLKRWL